MEEQIEAILKFHMPRWNELPDIDLYLDQVVNYIERYLGAYFINKEDKVITKTMINNYVKQGVMPAPEKKKYNRAQIALTIKNYEVGKAYNRFCANLEVSIRHVFTKKEFPKCDQMTEEQYLLKNVVQSFANKLYVEVKFLNKERISADK